MSHIGVIGGGSWGTALAHLLANKHPAVRLWVYEPELVDTINSTHCNSYYLPDTELPTNLVAFNDVAEVVKEATMLVMVTPSHALRMVSESVGKSLDPETTVVCCTKGIEAGTGNLMSDILAETLPGHPAERLTYLSGPSFAKEVADEHPTAVVIAGSDRDVTKQVQEAFRVPFFLPYLHHDVIGVELGGALKNVMALATGMVEGLGYGYNSRAALITRGLYEMIKLGKALGAEPITFAGLAGMGDLILTCTGGLSRNRSVGLELGKGRPLDEVLGSMRMVAEGVRTAEAIHELIERHQIVAPICTAVYEILYQGKDLRTALLELTATDIEDELGGAA